MPPAKRKNFEKRPQWRSHAAGTADDQQAEELAIVPLARITAAERREIYARVLWLYDYKLVFDAETEANAESVRALMVQYTSAHTSRLMRRDTPEGHCAARAVEMRLRDCVGFLERSRNRLHVPISQAAKAIVYLSSQLQLSSYARRLSGHPRHSNVIQYMLDKLRKNRLIHTMSHMATLSSTVKDMF